MFPGGRYGVGYECHDEEDEEEARITCSQVIQQLESCVGIHDALPPNIRTDQEKETREVDLVDFHDTTVPTTLV